MTEPSVIAYQVGPEDMVLEPAPARRKWMDATSQKFANRCLPLLMANAYGWQLTLKSSVTAVWDGGDSMHAMDVSAKPGLSIFGHGVLTFHVPWLFRTPPGVNLLVRGPANQPKDGIGALEGLVETDWAPMSFTVNWRFTRVGSVTFHAGEPIALLTPQPRGFLESLGTETANINDDQGEAQPYYAWSASRNAFHAAQHSGQPSDDPAVARGWQRDYFLGRDAPAGVHQRKIDLEDFDADRDQRLGEQGQV